MNGIILLISKYFNTFMKWLKKLYASNLGKVKYSDYSLKELDKLIKTCTEIQNWIIHLKKQLPDALFSTNITNVSDLINNSPIINFVVDYNKYKDHIIEYLKYQNIKGSENIQINGFLRTTGYDHQTVYQLNEQNKLIKSVYSKELFFESSENVLYLIQYNTIRPLENAKSWKLYSNDQHIQNTLKLIEEYNLSIKDAEQLFLDVLPNNIKNKNSFIEAFREWYWSSKNLEDFRQHLESAAIKFNQELNNNKNTYIYDMTMNPRTEGGGKFIDLDILEEAYKHYGDFKVVIRYRLGRVVYNASDVVRFKSSNDDESFQFFDQLDGIRDIFIFNENK